MPAIQVGNLTYNYQPDGDNVRQGPDGSGEATLVYKTTVTGFTLNSIPRPLSPHPTYSQLKLFEAAVTREAGGWYAVSATYRGVLIPNPLVYMQEQFTVSTTEAPIETHPLFSLPRANPRVSPQQLTAIRLALENNRDFTIANPFATAIGVVLFKKLRRGIENYLRIGGVYRQSYIAANIPQGYKGLGRIAKVAKAPKTPVGTNWLWTAFNWRKAGGLVTIEKEFTLSGLEGWEPEIYDSNYLRAYGL